MGDGEKKTIIQIEGTGMKMGMDMENGRKGRVNHGQKRRIGQEQKMENQGQGGVEPGEGTRKTQLGNWDQRMNGKWMGLTSLSSLPSWLGTSINRTV